MATTPPLTTARGTGAVRPAVALVLAAAASACAGAASTPRSLPRSASVPPAVSSSPSQAARPAVSCSTPAQRRRVTIRVNGDRRQFLLATPRRSGRAPLVVVFHGFAQTGGWIDRYTQLSRVGTRRGFVVATPQGVLDRWNFPRRRSIGPDDVAFFVAMTTWLASHECVDRRSVFLTGFSDGADMAGTAACAEPSRVRAIAVVAASVIPRRCRGPVDVLQIHGDRDPIVPFEGGGGDREPPFDGNEPVSAPAQLHAWERVDGCALSADRRTIAADVYLLVARSCRSGHVAELMVVRGGGHTWPGAATSLPYGATTHAVSATRQILYFFQHVRRG